MAEPISIQQLKDASEDAISLADFINKPENVMIPRRLASDINSLQYYLDYMSSYAQHSYETYDEMVANASNLSENVSVFVTNDSDTSKNGIYTYNGTSFVKGDYQPENAAKDYVENRLGGLEVFDGKVRAQDVSTADGSTQEVKNTEFRNGLDALPFEGGVLADTFVMATARGAGTIARTQKELNAENLTPYDFGGIGDGLLHPLSERYESLELAKADYPNAVALTDSIDYHALSSFFAYCKSNFVVNPSISFKAYLHKPLDLTGEFKTLVYYGDLYIANTQTVEEIEYLIRLNVVDLKFMGKLTCTGAGGDVKDRKQLAGVLVGDGGTDGSGGRTHIDTVNCSGFRDFGVALINDSIFPSIRYSFSSNIGAVGFQVPSNNRNAHHAKIIAPITSVGTFDHNQHSSLKVDSLPPNILGKYRLKNPVMLQHAGELYRVTAIDEATSTITVFPTINLNQLEVKDIAYIYGIGVAWIGNNAGCGNFGQLQAILTGIGFWGRALYGANINNAVSEYCGVGFTAGEVREAVISYTVNNSYFETNGFNYVEQWSNEYRYNMVRFLGAHELNVTKCVSLYGYRVAIYDVANGGQRVNQAMNSFSAHINGQDYHTNRISSMETNLTTSADLLYLQPRAVTQLVATKDLSLKFGILRRLMVIPPHNMEMTIKSPVGWGGTASLVLPISTKHTLVRVVINIENNSISYQPDVEVAPPKVPLAKKGATAERPISPELGARYYDTSLLETGKPISWNGSNWVDALGVIV